jgi:hypothetical protein
MNQVIDIRVGFIIAFSTSKLSANCEQQILVMEVISDSLARI